MIIYNFACGDAKIANAINCDINEELHPDKVVDLLKPLEIEKNSVDQIYFHHAVEHFPEKHHAHIFTQFHKILKPEGLLQISYPEFEFCARNWLENKHGKREFWGATIYGRQRDQWDFHLALMHTPTFIKFLREVGFTNFSRAQEPIETYNTVIRCTKGERMKTYEDVLKKEVLGA